MTWYHIAIELFFAAVGVFACWSIYNSVKTAWPKIVEIMNESHKEW